VVPSSRRCVRRDGPGRGGRPRLSAESESTGRSSYGEDARRAGECQSSHSRLGVLSEAVASPAARQTVGLKGRRFRSAIRVRNDVWRGWFNVALSGGFGQAEQVSSHLENHPEAVSIMAGARNRSRILARYVGWLVGFLSLRPLADAAIDALCVLSHGF